MRDTEEKTKFFAFYTPPSVFKITIKYDTQLFKHYIKLTMHTAFGNRSNMLQVICI